VTVIVRRADGALRVPAAALRYRPEGFEAGAGARRPAASGTGGAGGAVSAASAGGGEGRGPGASGFAGRSGRGPEGGGRRTGRGEARGDGEGGGSRGLVFVPDEKGQPQAVRVRLGISDGQFVEVKGGVEEGARVVTGVVTGARAATGRPSPGATSNPFAPGPPQRRQR
jgi:HlyD family secretion protein